MVTIASTASSGEFSGSDVVYESVEHNLTPTHVPPALSHVDGFTFRHQTSLFVLCFIRVTVKAENILLVSSQLL